MEEYALATLDALDAIHPGRRVDVIGEHTGSVEAVALAHLVPERLRKIGLIALPVYTEEERAERMGTRGARPVEPDIEGSHYLALWRRRLAYRDPPYDLAYLHALTVQELVSAGPHLAYRAVFSYPMAERLAGLPVPAVVFAPHDDLAEQTARAAGTLPDGSEYVDLPDLALDLFHEAPDRLAALIQEHLGTGLDPTPNPEEH
jgi:pimeloyl-ACP methyl ester carboxylesterase